MIRAARRRPNFVRDRLCAQPRPLFEAASNQLKNAAKLLQAQLDKLNLPPQFKSNFKLPQGAGGAPGAVVSTVTDSGAESAVWAPPGACWRAVIRCAPSARVVLPSVVTVVVVPVATAEPMGVPSA